MSEKIVCPCIANERTRCGLAECWHFTGGDKDCALCHCTGRVEAGTAVKLIRKLKRQGQA